MEAMTTRRRLLPPLLFLAALALLSGVALADAAGRPSSFPSDDTKTAFGETFGGTQNIAQRYTFAGREASAHTTAGAPMYYRNRMYGKRPTNHIFPRSGCL
jgi:hypothetical protein